MSASGQEVARFTVRPRVVVVPLDGSSVADEVLPVAHHLAGVFHARLLRLVVGDGEPTVRADVVLEGPDPAAAILAHLTELDQPLVCLSSHGRGGWRRRLVGSVAEELIRRSPSPVVVVGPRLRHELLTLAPRSLLVAVGRPPVPEVLLPATREWAKALGASVVLAHVRDPDVAVAQHGTTGSVARAGAPDLDAAVAALAAAGVPARAEVMVGADPVPPLLELGETLVPPVLLVAQTHRHGADHPGTDVTYRLLQEGPFPVLATVGEARAAR